MGRMWERGTEGMGRIDGGRNMWCRSAGGAGIPTCPSRCRHDRVHHVEPPDIERHLLRQSLVELPGEGGKLLLLKG